MTDDVSPALSTEPPLAIPADLAPRRHRIRPTTASASPAAGAFGGESHTVLTFDGQTHLRRGLPPAAFRWSYRMRLTKLRLTLALVGMLATFSARATTLEVIADPATAPPCGSPPASILAQAASCASRVDEEEGIQTVSGKYRGVCRLTYYMPNGALDSSNDYTLQWSGATLSTTQSGAHPNVCECQKLLSKTVIPCQYAGGGGGGVPAPCDPYGVHTGDTQIGAAAEAPTPAFAPRRYLLEVAGSRFLLVQYQYSKAAVPVLAEPGDTGLYFARQLASPFIGRYASIAELVPAYETLVAALNGGTRPTVVFSGDPSGALSLVDGRRSVPMLDGEAGFGISWHALTSLYGGYLGYGYYPRLTFGGQGDPDVVLHQLRLRGFDPVLQH